MNRNRLVIGLTVALVLAFLLSAWIYKYIQRITTQTADSSPDSPHRRGSRNAGIRHDAGRVETSRDFLAHE